MPALIVEADVIALLDSTIPGPTIPAVPPTLTRLREMTANGRCVNVLDGIDGGSAPKRPPVRQPVNACDALLGKPQRWNDDGR